MIAFVVEADLTELQRQAGARLSELLRGPQAILFLSSGGSSLALLDHIDKEVLGGHLTIGVTDDRWSTDPVINNFLQLSNSTFGAAAHEHGCDFITSVPQPNETIEQTAQRFEAQLRAWKEEHPHGSVVITQGMGPDGHTCGILPFPENSGFFEKHFNDPGHWATGYTAPGKNKFPDRITITLPFLREVVDHAIVYIASEDKEPALREALAPGNPANIPARIFAQMKDVEIYSVFKGG